MSNKGHIKIFKQVKTLHCLLGSLKLLVYYKKKSLLHCISIKGEQRSDKFIVMKERYTKKFIRDCSEKLLFFKLLHFSIS